MRYLAFLLDIDGLLWDERPIISARERVFGNHGLTPSDVEYGANYFIKQKGFYTWGDIFSTLGEDYQKLLREHKQYIRPYTDTVHALETLKVRGCRIAYVTNGPKIDTDYKMECLGIGEFAEFIITTDDIRVMKPSPKGILLALEKMGLAESKSHAVYVGDAQSDLDTANNAGIDGALVRGKGGYSGMKSFLDSL